MLINKFILITLLVYCSHFVFFLTNVKACKPEVVLNQMKYVTPYLEDDKIKPPSQFAKSNNLRRKVGSPFFAKGKALIVEGFVTDLFDNPVDNIVMKIWQANSLGYYHHLLPYKQDFEKYDIDFEHTGTATTDINGKYIFFTVMPGFFPQHAPYINIIIYKDNEDILHTAMYFPNHPRNIIDVNYKTINYHKRNLLLCTIQNISIENNNDIKCYFNIKLNLINQRKRDY